MAGCGSCWWAPVGTPAGGYMGEGMLILELGWETGHKMLCYQKRATQKRYYREVLEGLPRGHNMTGPP